MSTRLRGALALVFLAVLAGCSASVLPEIHSESERVATAERMYQRGQYVDASELLRGYIQRNAGTAQVDGAIILLGRCLLKQRTWLEAQEQFERLLRDYPESDSAGSAAYLLGEALYGQSRPKDFDQQYTQRALDQWKEYLRLYPGHWCNDLAQRRAQLAQNQLAQKLVDTGDLYRRQQLWDPARMYYERTRTDFPESLPSADAEVGLAILQAHKGDKDGAVAALRDIEARFPGRPVASRAARERERIAHQRKSKG